MLLRFVRLYLLTLLPFVLLDALWLGVVARRFYRAQIGALLARTPNWWAAGVFYLLFVAGIVVFVVAPALERGSPLAAAALAGAFFGLVTYAAYDLTNLATLEGWPVTVTVVDMAWGTLLCALTALVGVRLCRLLGW
jgi:uncharacterized membrane protein